MGRAKRTDPIYDTVFQYLMENVGLAKLLLSTILGEAIVALAFKPQERIRELGPARGGQHRAHARVVGPRLDETPHAMLVGDLAGGNGGPHDRRHGRVQARQVADAALLHQGLQGRHLPGIQQRVNQLPVGGVPADQEDLARQGAGRGIGVHGKLPGGEILRGLSSLPPEIFYKRTHYSTFLLGSGFHRSEVSSMNIAIDLPEDVAKIVAARARRSP